MPSIALVATQPGPCFVCATPTRSIRSGKHLDRPPNDPEDYFRICLACDADWTAALSAADPPPTGPCQLPTT